MEAMGLGPGIPSFLPFSLPPSCFLHSVSHTSGGSWSVRRTIPVLLGANSLVGERQVSGSNHDLGGG